MRVLIVQAVNYIKRPILTNSLSLLHSIWARPYFSSGKGIAESEQKEAAFTVQSVAGSLALQSCSLLCEDLDFNSIFACVQVTHMDLAKVNGVITFSAGFFPCLHTGEELRYYDWCKYLQTTKNLIDKKLYVIICKLLTFHNVVQICSHEMGHKVSRKQAVIVLDLCEVAEKLRTGYKALIKKCAQNHQELMIPAIQSERKTHNSIVTFL